jgi:folate-dependent phosphoribosylglycinamide formyltransferase PurN
MVPGGTLTSSTEPCAQAISGGAPSLGGGRVVLLTGPGYSSDIVANYLASRVSDLVVVVENPQSRMELARRRARRVGWLSVFGQVLFVVLVLPVLRHLGARRRAAIFRAASVDTTHRAPAHRVRSVNDNEAVALLTSLVPDVVVVHGTRIIAKRVLRSIPCPVVNIHAGITLRYRGVHGGYWALAEQHADWVGTTVHLVDPGIDTGGILAQTTFEVSGEDTIATYPDLHLVHGLPLLGAQLEKVMAGTELEPLQASIAPGSGFYYHPTIWGYFWRRWRHRLR